MDFLHNHTAGKGLLVLNILLALGYFGFLVFFLPVASVALYILLMVGEVFHVWQVLTYIHTVWPREAKQAFDQRNPQNGLGSELHRQASGLSLQTDGQIKLQFTNLIPVFILTCNNPLET